MGSQPRIGVYVCHCGSNIAGTVDVAAVADFARGLGGVVVARDRGLFESAEAKVLGERSVDCSRDL